MSKVCSAPVEIGSGSVLLLQWRCVPSGGRSPSEDAEVENLFIRLYAPPEVT